MKTKLVFNKLIPFNGFLAMTLWPFIFVREELAKMYSVIVNNHEHIHAEQQKEMLIVGFALALIGFVFGLGWWALLFVPIFLWWYFLEWIIRIPIEGSSRQAYRNISFEREAYEKGLIAMLHEIVTSDVIFTVPYSCSPYEDKEEFVEMVNKALLQRAYYKDMWLECENKKMKDSHG